MDSVHKFGGCGYDKKTQGRHAVVLSIDVERHTEINNYNAFQAFSRSAFHKRNENAEYFAGMQYDFLRDIPKTIYVKSSRLSNLIRLKVR